MGGFSCHCAEWYPYSRCNCVIRDLTSVSVLEWSGNHAPRHQRFGQCHDRRQEEVLRLGFATTQRVVRRSWSFEDCSEQNARQLWSELDAADWCLRVKGILGLLKKVTEGGK